MRKRRLLIAALLTLALGACSAKSSVDNSSSAPSSANVNTEAGARPPHEPSPSVKIWKTLSLLEPQTKKMPEDVKALIGKRVKVAGFTIVNEIDGPDELAEFLITPISGGCVHVPPPPPNYIVHVVMKGGKKAKILFGPVEVEGVIRLPAKSKDREYFSFEIEGESLEKFQPTRQPGST